MILASGSLYCTSVGMIGMQIEVDGVVKGYSDLFCNNTSDHKMIPTQSLVVGGLSPGSHTITLAYDSRYSSITTSDGNDLYSVTVLQLPF